MPTDCQIREILKGPGLSPWLRAALRSALSRDPGDAARDAGVLALILERRAAQLAAEGVISKAKNGPAR